MADKVSEFLTQKAGPLPVGVWIIAAGGGIGIALYMRRYSTPADTTPVGTEDQSFTQGGSTFTPDGVGGTAGSGGSNVPPLPTAPSDNDEWFQRASNYLVGKGLSGSQVSYSLGRWLGGESLTPQDRAIVDMAIAAIGNPPTQPPPSPNAPPPPVNLPPRTTPPMPGVPGNKPVHKPGPPVRPHLVSATTSRATLAVTAVPGATSYRWFLDGDLANSTPGPTVTLTNLASRKAYSVGVQPMNSAGVGPLSGGFIFHTK